MQRMTAGASGFHLLLSYISFLKIFQSM